MWWIENQIRLSEALGLPSFFHAQPQLSDCQTDATRGDAIIVDMQRDVCALNAHPQIVLLVDEATVRILRACTFQTSPDGREWMGSYWPSIPVYLQEIYTTLSGELAGVCVDLERLEIGFWSAT